MNGISRKTIILIVAALLVLGGAMFIVSRPHEPQSAGDVGPFVNVYPQLSASSERKYLAFQLFTDESPLFGFRSAEEPKILPKGDISKLVQDIKDEIGTTGTADRQLAFFVGPVALDHSDNALRQLVNDSFEIAREKNVAVGFHIDDSMFWARRGELLQNKENVEWLDWQGTLNTGRRLDWSEEPAKIAPQMCFNAPDIKKGVTRVASEVIGAEIKKNLDELNASGRGELFAGVIAGWETQMGQDFDTGKPLGYCALTHKGFSATNPPRDADREREIIVKEFVELWAGSLVGAGIDSTKIYSHVAFIPKKDYEREKSEKGTLAISYSEHTKFTPSTIAFGENYLPGFSTYPATNMYFEIYDEILKNDGPAWASSEGTNVVPPGFPGEASMEIYLARMYNHGATLVNIFGWGVGGFVGRNNPYRRETENDTSIAAYRKFLNGEALHETAIPDGYGLAGKVQRIQKELPAWFESGGDRKKAEGLLQKMMEAIGKNKFMDADKIADEILKISDF